MPPRAISIVTARFGSADPTKAALLSSHAPELSQLGTVVSYWFLETLGSSLPNRAATIEIALGGIYQSIVAIF